jgi:hypothetical protein
MATPEAVLKEFEDNNFKLEDATVGDACRLRFIKVPACHCVLLSDLALAVRIKCILAAKISRSC